MFYVINDEYNSMCGVITSIYSYYACGNKGKVKVYIYSDNYKVVKWFVCSCKIVSGNRCEIEVRSEAKAKEKWDKYYSGINKTCIKESYFGILCEMVGIICEQDGWEWHVDCDTLFCGIVREEVGDVDKGTSVIGSKEVGNWVWSRCHYRVGIPSRKEYYNCGWILYNCKWFRENKGEIIKGWEEYIGSEGKYDKVCVEQDYINIVWQRHGNGREIERNGMWIEFNNEVGGEVINHYINKPWRRVSNRYLSEEKREVEERKAIEYLIVSEEVRKLVGYGYERFICSVRKGVYI